MRSQLQELQRKHIQLENERDALHFKVCQLVEAGDHQQAETMQSFYRAKLVKLEAIKQQIYRIKYLKDKNNGLYETSLPTMNNSTTLKLFKP